MRYYIDKNKFRARRQAMIDAGEAGDSATIMEVAAEMERDLDDLRKEKKVSQYGYRLMMKWLAEWHLRSLTMITAFLPERYEKKIKENSVKTVSKVEAVIKKIKDDNILDFTR